jgi:transposase
MTKHDEHFKLSVVQQYVDGTGGFQTIAKQHGLSKSQVSRWVASFRAHGVEGLTKKFSHYSADFKLSVLEHMWENELSCSQTAALFNIRNPGILSFWEREYRRAGLDALVARPRGRPKLMPAAPPPTKKKTEEGKRSEEDLLAELEHLRMENAYLKKLQALVQARQQALPKKRK